MFITWLLVPKVLFKPNTYFSELVTARIDSMRSSDQLLVKCAAVLGKCFRRDVLKALVPKAHRHKLRLGVRRLIESGVFQCSKKPAGSDIPSISHNMELTDEKYLCFCSANDVCKVGEISACFEPMFSNSLLQKTAYETLIESQRGELHTKAAMSLELIADEVRNKVPYYMLCRPPKEDLSEQLKRLDMKMQGEFVSPFI